MIKQFWQDPYLTTMTTKVVDCDGPIVRLAATIFYAMTGGQQSDVGTIGGYPVIEARVNGLQIDYILPPDHQLKVSDQVTVTIDWTVRYRVMRLHMAAELVLELMYQLYQQPEKIGANITSEKARIDFQWPTNISLVFPELLGRVNQMIDSDYPISSSFVDESNQQRAWRIAGFAQVACGGTHLKSTSEIGTINLKRVNIGQGKERIEITLCD